MGRCSGGFSEYAVMESAEAMAVPPETGKFDFEAPADADSFKDEKDKFEKYFSDKPGAR